MPDQQHLPKQVRTYHVGSDSDTEPELLNDGFSIDQLNMRATSKGDAGSEKKISGEIILFPNIDNRCVIGTGLSLALSYVNIGATKVNGHVVEFWADELMVLDPYIKVDGQIVAMSNKLPITHDHPLQIDTDESCVGGDVFITDFNVPPMLFNVEDMMTNSGMLPNTTCTDKYFAAFNIDLYVLQLSFQVDHPVFIQLATAASGKMIAIGSGAGNLQVGAYQYAVRLVDKTGNRTRLSPFTPMITVPKTLSSDSQEHTYSMTEGANGGTGTPFGIHFRVRLTNLNAYDQLEVIRAKYIGETPIGTIPQLEVIFAEKLATHAVYDILDFYDAGTVTPIDIITEEEEPEALGGIDAAKGIRYFNKRVHLMNIKYSGRSIDNLGFNQSPLGAEMYPVMKKLNKKGFSDPYHNTYDRSHLHGEKYGFGVFLWDQFANKTFTRKVPNFDNFQMPSRRDSMSTDSQGQSFEGRVRAATIYGTNTPGKNKVDDTFEVFDHYNAKDKNLCEFADGRSFKNIIDDNPNVGLCLGAAANRRKSIVENYCSPVDGSLVTNCFGIDRVYTHDINYQPFTPTPKSNDVRGHRYIVNPTVVDPIVSGSEITYNPKAFGLDHYSLGMGLQGLNNIPAFASGFSVARSAPAKRVVMQGIGFYRVVSGLGAGSAMSKNTSAICFYSPDSDTFQGLVSAAEISDIVNNPQDYQIEVQSALGFFSEVYNSIEKQIIAIRSKGVDMMCYARILRDKVAGSEINPNESNLMGIAGSDGYNYVGFGKWRQHAQNASSPFAQCNASGTNGLFDISTVHQNFGGLNANDSLGVFNNNPDSRGNFMIFETVQPIYQKAHTGANSANTSSFSASGMSDWHEPAYIINIIKKNANVPNNNINSFIDTGTYVKIKSIIGISDGADPQRFLLVDERWEDCCPVLDNSWQNFATMATADRFITVKDNFGNETKWLNVTWKSGPTQTAILTAIQANGFYVASGVKVYGVYTHSVASVNSLTDAVEVRLVFTQFDTSFPKALFIPSAGSSISVAYDNTVPVRVFGGDCVSGETVFSPIDNRYDDNGDPYQNKDKMGMDVGFPFSYYRSNPRNYIVHHPKGVNKIADWADCDAVMKPSRAAFIRQMCVMFTCTSRIHSPYFVQDTVTINNGNPTNFIFFPSINYIMRPNEWDSGDITKNIWSQYFTDYPGEASQWIYGGFRFLHLTNIDYSKNETIQVFSSKPAAGFTQRTDFCTRDVWSDQRLTNVQNDANVRTFPALNFKDIEDRQGAIKFAWDAASGAGGNLYAICERGIALLLTNKQILQQVAGGQLATMGVTGANEVLTEEWLSKTIGMNDEFWRSAAEFDNTLYFCNKNSAYKFFNNQVEDIGRKKYHKRLYNKFLSRVKASYGTDMCAAYDTLTNEYWVSIRNHHRIFQLSGGSYNVFQNTNPASPLYVQNGDIIDVYLTGFAGNFTIRLQPLFSSQITINNLTTVGIGIEDVFANSLITLTPGQSMTFSQGPVHLPPPPVIMTAGILNELRGTLVHSEENKYWFGKYDYDFDKMLSFDNKAYGFRQNETYELGKGFVIKNNPIRSELLGVCNVESERDKEFVRIRINSDNLPSKIEFYDTMAQVDAGTPICVLDTSINTYALKVRRGYEQYIPKKTAPPNLRVQGRKIIFKVIHERANEEFKIISTEVSYKTLR